MKYTALLFSTLLVFSCNNTNNQNKKEMETVQNTDYHLIGKKATISFPEMKASVTYTSDSSLHWKTIDKEGAVAEGDEKINYQMLTDNLHFLNWIEKDGWTVSQIIDTKNGTVKAFWSFNDDKSTRGKRSSMFVDAKFEYVK
jgi:hypothetical protein